MDKKLLRPVEAALLLGVSRSLLYVMLMRGELPSITIHKARRIPAAALDQYIEDRLAQRSDEVQLAPSDPPAPRRARPSTRPRRTSR